MLVLSRKASEKIHIGDDITVEVRRVAGNRVTIAIDAPREIRILRGELHQSATDFADPRSEEDAPAKQTPAEASPAIEAAANETFIVPHTRVPVTDTLPQSDLSDHGMTAYAI